MNKKRYYEIAGMASKDETHPAQQEIVKYTKFARRVLDLGCGEGTRLLQLKTSAEKYGVDLSSFAVKIAKKKNSQIKFLKADIKNLPFTDNYFDLIYSMFVIEHLIDPQKVLDEAIRILAKGGILIIGAPNYGSPNRHSPISKENKFLKLLKGIFPKVEVNKLNWTKVGPYKGKYFIDSDTVVEPYLFSLTSYLKFKGMKIVKSSSLWSIDDFSPKQLVFKILGQLGIKPFIWWGPQILVIAEKI